MRAPKTCCSIFIPSRSPESIIGWIVEMFAENILALRDDASGKRIEIWLGVDPFIAQNMVEMDTRSYRKLSGSGRRQ